MPRAVRMAAALIALAVLATMGVRLYVNVTGHDVTFPQSVWNIFRFFTIWTNTFVGVVCGWIALGGRPPHWMTAGLAMAITMVAGVYHVLLAHQFSFTGTEWILDQMFHTFIPIAFVLFWILALPKANLSQRDMVYWIAYPMVYCVYALTRAAFDGIYPYPFLNVARLGATGVAINVAGLIVVFALAGLVVLGVGRLVERG